MPLRPVGVELQMLIEGAGTSPAAALSAYMKLGDTLRLDRLRHDALNGLDNANYWERLATRRLIEDLRRHQAQATAEALNAGDVDQWLRERDSERKALVQQQKHVRGVLTVDQGTGVRHKELFAKLITT